MSNAPERILGMTSGMVILRVMVKRLAPEILADSSNVGPCALMHHRLDKDEWEKIHRFYSHNTGVAIDIKNRSIKP